MHRILSRSAAEKLLIVVRGLSYLQVTQLKVPRTHRIIVIFLRREELNMNLRKLTQCEHEWKNHFLYQSMF